MQHLYRYWGLWYWKQQSAEEFRMRLILKAFLIKIQSNGNLSHWCLFFKRGWDYLAFSAPHSHASPCTKGYSPQSAPQPAEGFCDSISSHIQPWRHHRSPKGSVSCTFTQPISTAGEFHLFSNLIQSLTTEITPAQHLSLISGQFFSVKRENTWKSSWTNSSP